MLSRLVCGCIIVSDGIWVMIEEKCFLCLKCWWKLECCSEFSIFGISLLVRNMLFYVFWINIRLSVMVLNMV